MSYVQSFLEAMEVRGRTMSAAGIHIRNSLGMQKARERLKNAEEALKLLCARETIQN